MRTIDKKEALRAYKERKPEMGVYAVRCSGSGECWVGHSRTLDKIQNRIWTGLRLGTHPNRAMQQAWNVHGEQAFSFERLEELPEAETEFPDARLKALRAQWCEALHAQTI